ncbi:hypothetical protein GOODEAATRI_019042, partial [Goodea atripinnis]
GRLWLWNRRRDFGQSHNYVPRPPTHSPPILITRMISPTYSKFRRYAWSALNLAVNLCPTKATPA